MSTQDKDNLKDLKRPDENIVGAAQKAAKAESAPAPVRRYRTLLFQGTLIVVICTFAALTLLASTTAYFPIDLKLTLALQSINFPFFAGLMSLISWAGFSPQSLIVSALFVVMLYGFGYHWESVMAALGVGFVQGLNTLVKIVIHRPRPAADLVNVVNQINSFSFPSGHVMFYTGFFGFLWFLAYTLLKRSWLRTFLLVIFGIHVILIGASRVYLGEHWPSDVIGAYLLGFLALVVIIQVYRWGKTRFFVHQPTAPEPKNS